MALVRHRWGLTTLSQIVIFLPPSIFSLNSGTHLIPQFYRIATPWSILPFFQTIITCQWPSILIYRSFRAIKNPSFGVPDHAVSGHRCTFQLITCLQHIKCSTAILGLVTFRTFQYIYTLSSDMFQFPHVTSVNRHRVWVVPRHRGSFIVIIL